MQTATQNKYLIRERGNKQNNKSRDCSGRSIFDFENVTLSRESLERHESLVERRMIDLRLVYFGTRVIVTAISVVFR